MVQRISITLNISTVDTPKTSKDAVKMCKRRRKKVKTVRIEVASNAADGQDPNAPNISASAAQATLDKLAKTEYYTDEVCGEDDDGEIECYRLDAEEGNDDVITKEDEIGGEDDDWDYYYVPCDPAVDGEEEGKTSLFDIPSTLTCHVRFTSNQVFALQMKGKEKTSMYSELSFLQSFCQIAVSVL